MPLPYSVVREVAVEHHKKVHARDPEGEGKGGAKLVLGLKWRMDDWFDELDEKAKRNKTHHKVSD